MTHQDVGPEHGGRSPTPQADRYSFGFKTVGLRHASDAQEACALVSYASTSRFDSDPRYHFSLLADPAARLLSEPRPFDSVQGG